MLNFYFMLPTLKQAGKSIGNTPFINISDIFKLKTNLKNSEILTKNFSIFGIFCHKVQHIFGLHYLLINNSILV